MSLAALFPGARTLKLADREYAVSPWRLQDLLELERWIADGAEFPLEGIPSSEDDVEPSTRKRRLRAAMSKAKGWPPALDSAEGRAALATPHGAAFFLWVAISRDNPALSTEDLPALIEGMSALDWKRLNRTLWCSHPQEEILREIIPERFEGADGMTWPQVIDHLATERRMSYAEVLDLTLPEISNMLRRGEPRTYGLSNPSRAAIDEYQRRLLDDDEIPAWEARQRELDEVARRAEETANAESPPIDPVIARDAVRLGMDATALAESLAELDAKIAAELANPAGLAESVAPEAVEDHITP